MQSSAWIELLRVIPPAQYPNLVAMTTSGIEIFLQGLYRIEPEYLVVRGRLGGSTDQGKVMFLPFDRIQYLGFKDEIKEAQVQEMFNGRGGAAVPANAATPKLAPAPLASEPLPHVEDHQTPSPLPRAAEPRSPVSTKAALLERLRKLRAAQGGTPAGGN